MTGAPLQPPAGRYGPEPTARTRRLSRVAIAVLVIAVLAVVAWLGAGTLRDPVQWRDVGYHVDGDASIQVAFDVTKDVAATATCRVEAMSRSYAQVGVLDVTVGPGTTRTQRVTVEVPTSERAVTGTATHCDIVG